jgi:hypothetical protein
MMGTCGPVGEFAQDLEPDAPLDTIWTKWQEFCVSEKLPVGTQKKLWEDLEAIDDNFDPDAARILAKIRELGDKAPASKIRDCSEKFKQNPDVLKKKLQEMVASGRLTDDTADPGNNLQTKFYSIPEKLTGLTAGME